MVDTNDECNKYFNRLEWLACLSIYFVMYNLEFRNKIIEMKSESTGHKL